MSKNFPLLRVFGLFFLICPAFAEAAEFTGAWAGEGTFQSPGMDQAAPTQFRLRLQQSDTQLFIEDCWDVEGGETRGFRCYKSTFELDAHKSIYLGGRKVGDIFPGRIVIFVGHSQASEQMLISLNKRRELRFRYTYANFDGGQSVRFARIPETAIQAVR